MPIRHGGNWMISATRSARAILGLPVPACHYHRRRARQTRSWRDRSLPLRCAWTSPFVVLMRCGNAIMARVADRGFRRNLGTGKSLSFVRHHMTPAMIREIAQAVRSAIEMIPRDRLPFTFKSFPRGACGDTALVLGTYLEEDCDIRGFEYVCGDRGSKLNEDWSSHAWLERDGLFVDITADQFADAPSSIIVEMSSPWHTSFQNVERMKSNFHSWSGEVSAVQVVYGHIRNVLGSPWRER